MHVEVHSARATMWKFSLSSGVTNRTYDRNSENPTGSGNSRSMWLSTESNIDYVYECGTRSFPGTDNQVLRKWRDGTAPFKVWDYTAGGSDAWDVCVNPTDKSVWLYYGTTGKLVRLDSATGSVLTAETAVSINTYGALLPTSTSNVAVWRTPNSLGGFTGTNDVYLFDDTLTNIASITSTRITPCDRRANGCVNGWVAYDSGAQDLVKYDEDLSETDRTGTGPSTAVLLHATTTKVAISDTSAANIAVWDLASMTQDWSAAHSVVSSYLTLKQSTFVGNGDLILPIATAPFTSYRSYDSSGSTNWTKTGTISDLWQPPLDTWGVYDSVNDRYIILPYAFDASAGGSGALDWTNSDWGAKNGNQYEPLISEPSIYTV